MPRPSPHRRLLRAIVAALPAALLALAVAAVPASAGLIFPEAGGSQNADDIKELYVLIFVLALVVFVGVEGSLIYAFVRYRAKRGRTAAQIHGNTRLEIGWTVGAAVILVFITAFTFIKLPAIKDPPASDVDANGNPIASNVAYAATDQKEPPGDGAKLNIQINGQQYVWRFKYPDRDKEPGILTYVDMVVPVGVTVTLDITSDDVAHSWWIPKLGGKMDAVPGYVNKLWFKIPEDAIPEGQDRVVFEGQCAELCGRNHANMYGRVIGMRFDDYEAWYEREKAALEQQQQDAQEKREQLEAPGAGAAESG
jgi:cytochrome c oxidase subunit 2